MNVSDTPLDGLFVIEPHVFEDERGFFLESYQSDRYREFGMGDECVQDNLSRSIKGVLRGMHFQVKRPQSQFVTVMRGSIFDACVDLRPASPTYGQWYGVTLSDAGPRQLYMAPGIAHGFCVLSDVADLHYKVSLKYDPHDEGGLLWNDPDIGIEWPIHLPNVSERDNQFRCLKDLRPDQLPQSSFTEV